MAVHEPARGEKTGRPLCLCCRKCAATGPTIETCQYCGRRCSCEGCTRESAELRPPEKPKRKRRPVSRRSDLETREGR